MCINKSGFHKKKVASMKIILKDKLKEIYEMVLCTRREKEQSERER